MIEETIASLESRLHHAHGLSDEQRRELETLVATLKTELSTLPHAGPTGTVVKRANHPPQSLRQSVDALSTLLSGQEVQHPRITELVNSISLLLSNTGI